MKRQAWAKEHDQETSGIMGYLPLVVNMPVKITTTDHASKHILFKNRRCRLYGTYTKTIRSAWPARAVTRWCINLERDSSRSNRQHGFEGLCLQVSLPYTQQQSPGMSTNTKK